MRKHLAMRRSPGWFGLVGWAVVAVGLALGCAAPGIAPREVNDARLALQDAKNAGADTLASDQYNAAEVHLRTAESTWEQKRDAAMAAHYARLAESEARDAQFRAEARHQQSVIEEQTRRKQQLEIAVRDAEIRLMTAKAKSEAERQRLEAEARARAEREKMEADLSAREAERKAAEQRERVLEAQLEAERKKAAEQQRQAEIESLKAQVETERKAAEQARLAADQERVRLEEARKQEEARRAEAERLAAEREKAESQLMSRLQQLEKSTHVEARGIVVTLPGSVYFETGRADVRPAARDRLTEIGKALAAVAGRHILIEGHTDSTGRADFNLKLSQLRSESVKSILVGSGVSPDRIEVHGYGATKPVGSNATAAGRSQNRRVEIVMQGQGN